MRIQRLHAILMASAATVVVSGTGAFADAGNPWQGFYAGINADYATSQTKEKNDFGKWNGSGVGGGLQAGYNQDLGGFVLGGEADFGLNHIDGTSDPIFGGKKLHSQMDGSASLRARAGFPISGLDNVLVYGTGGLAIAQWRERYTDTGEPSDTDSKTYYGWTLGGGLEFPLSENMSLKAEYLYADYGSKTFDLTNGPYSVKNTTSTFRIGLNWHLDQ
jgi:outer membrane immunogenic protein